eukprot:CAMPEP_0173402456 /NCGR_PEP_ID=MMETSP1356-20130122/53941_1 /TAXON_ID=77927 ORGANISM="Hemiselmis virescens, Strain PCC157" /NCGR_SAMPLE_ID=MMETSP1356 /ASSEMBLY_ACC=CAM_ASM_000847 /LENGTH=127 /DNA_ID=CAMNT_0014362789 /DNA_START=297 /DNA_END=680 /DNA_ORIENTATION=-
MQRRVGGDRTRVPLAAVSEARGDGEGPTAPHPHTLQPQVIPLDHLACAEGEGVFSLVKHSPIVQLSDVPDGGGGSSLDLLPVSYDFIVHVQPQVILRLLERKRHLVRVPKHPPPVPAVLGAADPPNW